MIVSVEQIDPFSLPSVALEQRDQLPNVSGIYFAIFGADILYIGKSVNLQQRWQRHHRIKQIKSHGDVIIAWLPLVDPEENDLDRLEEACIEYFKPILNRTTVFIEGDDKAKITVLFPTEVHQTLKELAQIDERSFNGEVVWILRDYIARRKGANCESSLGKKNDE